MSKKILLATRAIEDKMLRTMDDDAARWVRTMTENEIDEAYEEAIRDAEFSAAEEVRKQAPKRATVELYIKYRTIEHFCGGN